MPMSRSFEPRQLDRHAWVGWHKDALRLMGRVGVLYAAGWIVLTFGITYGVWQLMGNGAGYVVAMGVMLGLGVLIEPLHQRALDPLAEGHRMDAFGAARLALADIATNKGWFFKRFLWQLFAMSVWLGFLLATILLGDGLSQGASGKVGHPLEPMSNLLVLLTIFPIFLRRNGTLSFAYWLQVRYGIQAAEAHVLNDRATHKNIRSAMATTATLLLLFWVGGLVWWVALVALPLLRLYYAAYLRCAYHDLFEDGTGLKDPVAETSSSSLIPVLQA